MALNRKSTQKSALLMLLLCFAYFSKAWAKSEQIINIAYITQIQDVKPVSSDPESPVPDKGHFGAELGIEDNNTTGAYTKQQFVLKKFVVPADGKVLDTVNQQIAKKFDYIITNLNPQLTLAVADLDATKTSLIFDSSTKDDELRGKACRKNVLHILPSRAMRTDALAQYLLKKRWKNLFLVIGNSDEDKLYAEAIKHSVKKFGLAIVQEKAWEHTFDARRSAQADVAVFTQVDDYDVLVVADEQDEFGDYLEYRTWLPRPVAGTQGLIATAWHLTHEQWGATQIQNRFKEKAGRWMEEEDYSAYLAVRSIGEAAARTQSNDKKTIRDYLLSDKFALQGYKGAPLSFRAWDNQMRQPILLAAARSLVAVAPIEGFLHPKMELDTLGFDQPETECQWSQQ